jgi:hypothetical protein
MALVQAVIPQSRPYERPVEGVVEINNGNRRRRTWKGDGSGRERRLGEGERGRRTTRRGKGRAEKKRTRTVPTRSSKFSPL